MVPDVDHAGTKKTNGDSDVDGYLRVQDDEPMNEVETMSEWKNINAYGQTHNMQTFKSHRKSAHHEAKLFPTPHLSPGGA